MDLRPLELGELVDRSAAVWRANWKPLFQLYLGFQLVQYVFLRLFELVGHSWFPLLRGGRAMQEALKSDPSIFLKQMVYAAPAIVVLMVVLTVMAHALSTAGAAYVVPLLYGKPASVGEAMRRTFERTPAILGVVGLSFIWLTAWGLVVLIPSAGLVGVAIAAENKAVVAIFILLGLLWGSVAMIGLLLGYVLRFATAGQALAMETVSAVGAYKRSGVLASGRIGTGVLGLVKLRLTLVITVVGLILLVVSIVAGLPAIIIEAVYGHVFDPANADPDAVPQAMLVPAQLLQIVTGSLVAPLYAVAMGLYYVDMRMRREGLDLELKLGRQRVIGALLAAALSAAPCAAAEDSQLEKPAAEALCALAEREAPTLEADRARLDDIFSRDRYAHARKSDSGAFKALMDRLWAWFAALGESSGAQSFSQVTRFVVLTLAAIVAAIGALRLAGRWNRGPRPIATEPTSTTALVLDSPAEHLARARAALANAPREAIRQGLFALLSALEEARLARPDRVRTNRELVRELPSRGADPTLVARVEPLMHWYDGAFYSLDAVPQEGALRFVDDVERLSGELKGAPAR